MKKKLLLTGGTGFLGSVIAKKLKNDFDLTLLQRNKPRECNKGFSYIECDLSNSGIPEKKFDDWSVVVHAAGKAHVLYDHHASKDIFEEINVIGTKNLLRSLSNRLPDLFVFISSISVYGVNSGQNIDEQHPLGATDLYGMSKIKAEKEVLKWTKREGVDCVILRLPLIVGPNPTGNLGRMIKAIEGRRYVRIGKAEARKSMVWAGDIADLIPKLKGKNGIYNLTDQHHPSFYELENIFAKKLNRRIYSIPISIAYVISFIEKVMSTLGMHNVIPLDKKTLIKITETVTFDDSKSIHDFNWSPSNVLEKLREMNINQQR